MIAGLLAERPGACPRCGSSLRFEDEDGEPECVCGWSERSADPGPDIPWDPVVFDPAAEGDPALLG